MGEGEKLFVLNNPNNSEGNGIGGNNFVEIDGAAARARFVNFFKTFRPANNSFVYRDALIRHWSRNELFIEVDLAHVNQYDENLFDTLNVRDA